MDCQTCNDLLLDLAYGELDEVRAAAARKHMDSCGECRESFARVSRGRSLAKHIARDEAPAVSQTLRAAIEAQAARFAEAAAATAGTAPAAVPAGSGGDASRDSNVVPFAPRDGRVSRWFERVGELAMRRQVAMAAVFLVMIGVGVIFYQSHPRPTDAQDDRTPDVVPAVEITPSNGAQAGTGRLPTTTNSASLRDRDERARQANTNAGAPRPDPGVRDRMQANAHSSAGAGIAANADNEAVAREMEAERSVAASEAQQNAALAAQSAAARDLQAQGQLVAQAAPPAAHYAQPARQATQLDMPQPSPANVAPVAQAPMQQQVAMGRAGSTNTATNVGATDAIARLQAELAAATDEATRSRLRNQLIAAYEQRGMYAEANTLRSQSAEPANAASNSISNSAAGSAAGGGLAQTQAPPQNYESPSPSAGSSTRSTTHRSTMRRAAPNRAGSRVDAYDAMGL